MSLIAWLAVGALLLYFALRVAQMKRSMPFLIAYPLFVLILVGGGIAVFIGMSWAAVFLGLGEEAALGVVYGVTAAAGDRAARLRPTKQKGRAWRPSKDRHRRNTQFRRKSNRNVTL